MAQPEPGVLLLDDRRVLVATNGAAAGILGTSPEELIGRRADDFIPFVARPLYPLAWRGFLVLGHASGDYAAQRDDGSLAHLAYVGFANRPVRGLHLFLIERRKGTIRPNALVPRMQENHIQLGLDLPEETRERLLREAERQEWRLPVQKGGERSIVAALFDVPARALDTLDVVRQMGEASIATAAGATPDASLTLIAGRFPHRLLGDVVATMRERGGRVITHVDERWA